MARTPTPAGATGTDTADTNGTNAPSDTNANASGADTGTGDSGAARLALNADGNVTGVMTVVTGSVVEARVTLEFEDHAVNDVVQVRADRVDQLEREGYIDSHPEAVAYAKSLAA